MSTFEIALEECLASMTKGNSLEECLARYPEFSGELRPLLVTAQKVSLGTNVNASDAFRSNTRAQLGAHMRAHPRRKAWQRPQLVLRYASALAVLALAFTTTGFALAQKAIPGGSLYPWKLTSEQVWRGLNVNRISVDIELTQRRLQELLAVQNNPILAGQALDRYKAALLTLQTDVALAPEKALHARDAMNAQKAIVNDSIGNSVGNVDDLFTIIPTLDDLVGNNPQEKPEPQPTTTDLPLILTPVPSLVPKKPEVDKDDGDKNWIKQIITDLLGTP